MILPASLADSVDDPVWHSVFHLNSYVVVEHLPVPAAETALPDSQAALAESFLPRRNLACDNCSFVGLDACVAAVPAEGNTSSDSTARCEVNILENFGNNHTVHHFATHFDMLESEFEKKHVGLGDLMRMQGLVAAYAVQEKRGLDLCKLEKQLDDTEVGYG